MSQPEVSGRAFLGIINWLREKHGPKALTDLMEGWMIATMNTLGVDVIDPRESMCTSRGGTAHEFACRWKKG